MTDDRYRRHELRTARSVFPCPTVPAGLDLIPTAAQQWTQPAPHRIPCRPLPWWRRVLDVLQIPR